MSFVLQKSLLHRRTLCNLADTQNLASQIADILVKGDVLALNGDLGTGKTTFARNLIRARANTDKIKLGPIPSPTFTLVQQYDLPSGAIFHFDLYRISDTSEIWELGIEDAFIFGISIIEWADRADRLLPKNAIRINFSFGQKDTIREVQISRCGGV